MTLSTLTFNNHAANQGLPLFAPCKPEGLPDAKMVSVNQQLAQEMQLSINDLQSKEFLAIASGNKLLSSFEPIAMKYSGHQFGQYNPYLGDGRAILLGQQQIGNNYYDWHLKGAGQTPFSRSGDGRAVLRSSIREYLAGEALHQLRIPSTRALSLTVGSEEVVREQIEFSAMLLRIAPSHIRFGHFQYCSYQQDKPLLTWLADHVIDLFFPEAQKAPNPYLAWYREVLNRTTKLVAQWMAYGFNHGVLNTDNMSILGLTLDYGPYAFLGQYRRNFICNHSDHSGMYAFIAQPKVVFTNLYALAYALEPILSLKESEQILAEYEGLYLHYFYDLLRKRLGLMTIQDGDEGLITDLLLALEETEFDYNQWFRLLMNWFNEPESIQRYVQGDTVLMEWLVRYKDRIDLDDCDEIERIQQMQQVNPMFILHNHWVQKAIKTAEQGDFTETNNLLALVQSPFSQLKTFADYYTLSPQALPNILYSCSA